MVENQASFSISVRAREEVSDKLLNAKNPDLYYGNLYIECY